MNLKIKLEMFKIVKNNYYFTGKYKAIIDNFSFDLRYNDPNKYKQKIVALKFMVDQILEQDCKILEFKNNTIERFIDIMFIIKNEYHKVPVIMNQQIIVYSF